MVWIRYPDPKEGDMHQEMAPLEAVDFVLGERDLGKTSFGIWEGNEQQLELEMASRTGLLEVFRERGDDTLRLVPWTAGG